MRARFRFEGALQRGGASRAVALILVERARDGQLARLAAVVGTAVRLRLGALGFGALRRLDRSEAARRGGGAAGRRRARRSEEHTSELQSLMRISYAVFCLKKKKKQKNQREPKHVTRDT